MSESSDARENATSIYRDLPTTSSIRVVTLLQAVADEPLAAKLEVIDLDNENHLEYVALSYAWGSTELTEPVSCCSDDGSGTVWITQNLASIFRRVQNLKESDVPSRFWADAVCINQSQSREALQERAQQVQMMHRIFQSAHQVIADLGEEPNHLDMFFSTLNKITDFPDETLKEFERSRECSPDLKDIICDFRFWQTIGELARRPYFSRMWTLQEYVLADVVSFLVGTKIYDGAALVQTLILMSRLLTFGAPLVSLKDPTALMNTFKNFLSSQSVLSQMKKVDDLRQLRMEGSLGRLSICTLITQAWKCRSTDPRDKFYALHGLASEVDWRDSSVIQVDYTRDVDSLSLAVTKLFLRDKESAPDLLEFTSGVKSHLPSWCLDLRSSNESDKPVFLLDYLHVTGTYFSACGETHVDIELDPNDKFISFSACIVDEVVNLGPIEPPMTHHLDGEADLVKLIKDYVEWCQGLVRWTEDVMPQVPREKLTELTWRTLCADSARTLNGWERATADVGLCYQANLDSGLYLSEKLKHEFNIHDDDSERQEKAMKWSAHTDMAGSGRIASTRWNRMAMIPRVGEIGDKIAIISGLTMPFVLRQQEDGTYRIVGECYLHGAMDGEALDQEGFCLSNILIS